MTSARFLLLAAPWLVYACGSSDDGKPKSDPVDQALSVPVIDFGLEGERELNTLTDQEIGAACDELASVFQTADEGVACQIVAAATTEDVGACASERQDCLEAPAEAVLWSEVHASPEPVDCTKFDATLTTDCDHPVSLLEECVNAMAQSVVPAADAVSCSLASDIEDIGAANGLAIFAQSVDYVQICFPLLECEALVSALLGGSSDNIGGAPNN